MLTNWRPGQPVQLQTKRFQLHSLTAKDATPQLLAWVNDPDLMRAFLDVYLQRRTPGYRPPL